MGRPLDLTGCTIGRLGVIGLDEPRISPEGRKCNRWRCVCACGRELVVVADLFTKSKRPACERCRRPGLVGRQFGRLTVIARAAPRADDQAARKPRYVCRCTCGRTHEAYGEHLRSGGVRSCGCLRREITARTGRAQQKTARLDRGKSREQRLERAFADVFGAPAGKAGKR